MLNAHDPSALSESNSSPRRLALLAPVRFTAGFLAFSGRKFLQLRHELGLPGCGFSRDYLPDRNFSFRRKQQTMPRRPSGQNTIHHVDTKIGVFDNLFRCTHTHKIAGGLGGEMLNGGFDNLTCKFARLTDTKPANCVSGKSDL